MKLEIKVLFIIFSLAIYLILNGWREVNMEIKNFISNKYNCDCGGKKKSDLLIEIGPDSILFNNKYFHKLSFINFPNYKARKDAIDFICTKSDTLFLLNVKFDTVSTKYFPLKENVLFTFNELKMVKRVILTLGLFGNEISLENIEHFKAAIPAGIILCNFHKDSSKALKPVPRRRHCTNHCFRHSYKGPHRRKIYFYIIDLGNESFFRWN
jgi:hypothetical protein